MTYLSVKQASELLELTPRAVRNKIYNGEFSIDDGEILEIKGKGRGGKQYQIALESLPQVAQDRYYNKVKEYKPIDHYTGKQREEANFRAWIVIEYQRSKLSPDDYVNKFNTENPEDPITKSKLFRWQKKYRKSKDVADLIDNRGGHNRGKTSISDEAWDYFYCLYMTQQKLTIKRCWEFTKIEYPNIPSVSAFERKVKTIPEYAIITYREGPTALKDTLPSMQRSKLDIESNDILFSDHHKMDVFVLNKQGKIVRLWLTVFMDARSNMIVGHLLRESAPSATAVKECFRKTVEKHGIPKEVYFDNGKDYRSKSFSKDYPLSLVNQLGINTIYATPYHGQAKTVERFFGTLESRFGKLFPTYAGKDAKNRPENMRIPNKEIAKKAPTIEEFSKLLDIYIEEYNKTPSRGRYLQGKCPEQVYYENLKHKKELSDPDILRTLCGTFAERIVHENGIRILNNNYWHEDLIRYIRKQVIVSYHAENIDEINVFDMDNRAICVAKAKVVSFFRQTTEEDYRRATKETKAVKELTKHYKPSREINVLEVIAKNHCLETSYSDLAKPKITTQINPQIMENNAILKSSQVTSKRPEPEDDIALLWNKMYLKTNNL